MPGLAHAQDRDTPTIFCMARQNLHSALLPVLAPAQDREKPIIFSMARLDRVKNLTGLAEWYGRCERLRAAANLVIVGGIVDPSQTHVCGCCSLFAAPHWRPHVGSKARLALSDLQCMQLAQHGTAQHLALMVVTAAADDRPCRQVCDVHVKAGNTRCDAETSGMLPNAVVCEYGLKLVVSWC